MKNYHLLSIRPSLKEIEKMDKLEKFLRDNNLLLIHNEHQVKVMMQEDRGKPYDKEIAQFFIL